MSFPFVLQFAEVLLSLLEKMQSLSGVVEEFFLSFCQDGATDLKN